MAVHGLQAQRRRTHEVLQSKLNDVEKKIEMLVKDKEKKLQLKAVVDLPEKENGQ